MSTNVLSHTLPTMNMHIYKPIFEDGRIYQHIHAAVYTSTHAYTNALHVQTSTKDKINKQSLFRKSNCT